MAASILLGIVFFVATRGDLLDFPSHALPHLPLAPLSCLYRQAREAIRRFKRVLGGGTPAPPMGITEANAVMAAWLARVDAAKVK